MTNTNFNKNKRLHEEKAVSGASERKLWFHSDIIIVFALLAVAALVYFIYPAFFKQDDKPYCEITLDGKVVMTVELSKNKSFSLQELPNVVFEVKDGAIAFTNSDCPDKICVHSGYLHQAGQSAACLPNHTAISIKAKGGDDTPDIVI